MNYLNTSVYNIYSEHYYNTSSRNKHVTNFNYNNISENNIRAIDMIKSFSRLSVNWDSYNAKPPTNQAVKKSISFIQWLSKYNIEVFFVAPTPNGEILVEIKEGHSNVEFEFSCNSNDSICAIHEGEFKAEAELNETTQMAYLKWLICPDGNCLPNI